jgi:hypothetical protein
MHMQPEAVFVPADRRWRRRRHGALAAGGYGLERSSKADPRRQQDRFLKCLQGGRADPLTACGVATLRCSLSGAAGNETPSGVDQVDQPCSLYVPTSLIHIQINHVLALAWNPSAARSPGRPGRSRRGRRWVLRAPCQAGSMRPSLRACASVDSACSTHCRELERLARSSRRAGSACLLHAPRSDACLVELPLNSPPLGTACRRHARRSAVCLLRQPPWSSPLAGTACPRHARCTAACRLEQTLSSPPPGSACRPRVRCRAGCVVERTWSSPPLDTACPRRAPRSAACCLQPPWSSPRAGTACLRHAPHSVASPRIQTPWNSSPPYSVFLRHARCTASCLLEQPTSCSPRPHTASCPCVSDRFFGMCGQTLFRGSPGCLFHYRPAPVWSLYREPI